MAANLLTETQGFWPLWRMVVGNWRTQNAAATRTGLVSAHAPTTAAMSTPSIPAEPLNSPRFLIWADNVGAYLVCTQSSVVLGQPATPAVADIPIWADISRRHAILHRDREGYLLEPARETFLDGKPVQAITYVRHGQIIQLGGSVRLRFCKPHPLSMSARLEWVSHHRTQPATDGIVLLAEACILGPAAAAHIVCPQARQEAVIYRQGPDWQIRTAGELQIDGKTLTGKGKIMANSRILLPGASLSVEPLS
ncbi:MAG: FHA domain-containing protein [Pirellulales bacterium]|nr:FHA domain-containing protein [Pirellulales bacterium]